MIFTVKRKNIIAAVITALMAVFWVAVPVKAVLSSSPKPTATVVIDAGHGGVDGGVTGRQTGVKESDLNLAVAKVLKQQLEEANINVVLTRSTKNALYETVIGSFKRKDFERRKEIIEKAVPDAVISIHMNFYRSASRRGSQVFFNSANPSSRALGEFVQDSLNTSINRPYANRDFAALAGDYYIINCTDYASIIVECGFLSNPQDEALLIDEEYRTTLSYHIMSGILSYLSLR